MQKFSCTACATRKIKCDKQVPCTACLKSRKECVYRAPAPSQRHRKRPADHDLLSKINEYESLLRDNNIEFSPLDNSWVASPLEHKLVSKVESPTTQPDIGALVGRLADSQVEDNQNSPNGSCEKGLVPSESSRLWFELPKELRESTVDQLRWPVREFDQQAPNGSTQPEFGAHLALPIPFAPAPQLIELHPEPRQIFRMWQAFVDNVNPLSRVLHIPTAQKRILDISWNLQAVSKPFEAILFCVYSLAVASMDHQTCYRDLGEAKLVLLNRYRSAAAQALVRSNLHSTGDFEVLQALILFLLVDSNSDLCLMTTAIAVRMGNKMGLHKPKANSDVSFFDEEIQIRVWWQVMSLESRARRKSMGGTQHLNDFGYIRRLPLNVNDSELHPEMATPPLEHSGPTEMLYYLMKCEIAHYIRSWIRRTVSSGSYSHPLDVLQDFSPEGMAVKRAVLKELEKIYEEKYIQQCDPSIPLHNLTKTVARLGIHRIRFWFFHPRQQPDGGRQLPQEDQDMAFDSSVHLLLLDFDLRATQYASFLLQHMPSWPYIEALVYMISELRCRTAGELVQTAWRVVARLFADYPHLMHETGSFYVALRDLTLEAWHERWKEAGPLGHAIPEFITALQQKQRPMTAGGDSGTGGLDTVLGPAATESFRLAEDELLDWGDWHLFPQL